MAKSTIDLRNIHAKSIVPGQCEVLFWSSSDMFYVEYGKHKKGFVDHVRALKEYQACVSHQMTCEFGAEVIDQL